MSVQNGPERPHLAGLVAGLAGGFGEQDWVGDGEDAAAASRTS
ncbi:hypothetical protein [Streptomyces sp. NPDC007369]